MSATGNSSARFDAAIRRFDEENARDPHSVIVDGQPRPAELVYAGRLSAWVGRLAPEASEPLRLAARSQHICRWMIPRSSYPQTRSGYLQWRAELKRFHAEKSGAILREVGYDEAVVARVRELNLKQGLGTDPEVQVLEDALCLVTLEHQLSDLIARTEPEKMVSILQKTWKKMSPAAHQIALTFSYTPVEQALLSRALETSL